SQGKSDAAPNDRANANASPLSTPTPASETAISRATRANGSARKRGRYAGTKMTSAARAAATGRVASGGSSQRTADQAATAANAAGQRRGPRVQDTRRDEREDDTDVRHRARDERRSLVRLHGPRGARAARHEDGEERGHPEIDERADDGRAPVRGERDERDA